MAPFLTARRAGLPLCLIASLLAVLCSRIGAQAPRLPIQTAHHSDLLLQPGDKVQLKIWREPDLSGEFMVASDGSAVLPMVGRVIAAQLSTDSLRALLINLYSTALRDPAIEVTVLRRVTVVGEVRNPGFFYADPTVTVTGALALAGGALSSGNRKRVDLIRGGKRTELDISHPSTLADSPLQSGDQVSVPERSWLSRNTALVASAITGVALIFAARIHP